MGISKLLTILCCAYITHASQVYHHGHIIPVEGYKSELQNLGQHVEIPETPVKVVKITKTIAVKIPVPYPVKVIQKVPYPVHVSKPYPVPVPHIVKVPVSAHSEYGQNGHESLDAAQIGQDVHRTGNTYSVQENEQYGGGDHSYDPSLEHQDYAGNGGGNHAQSFDFSTVAHGGEGDNIAHSEEGSQGGAYHAPYQYGPTHGAVGSVESDNYDQAIRGYLQNVANQNNYGHH